MADEYISRQRILNYIDNEYCMHCEHSDGVRCENCHYEDVRIAIKSMPVADIQPVKCCRMIPFEPDCRGYTDVFICTNCQLHIHLGFIGKNYGGNFCLECGAEVKDDE